MNSSDQILDMITKIAFQIRDLELKHWLNYELFTSSWWISVIMTIFPICIFIKLVDKGQILKIALFGFLVSIFTSTLDIIGLDYVLWEYPVRVLPITHNLIPMDLVVVPVIFMLIYQYFRKFSKYLIATVIVSMIFSFVFEPLLVFLKIYSLILWRHVYSFPLYILIMIICKLVTDWLAKVQNKYT